MPSRRYLLHANTYAIPSNTYLVSDAFWPKHPSKPNKRESNHARGREERRNRSESNETKPSNGITLAAATLRGARERHLARHVC